MTDKRLLFVLSVQEYARRLSPNPPAVHVLEWVAAAMRVPEEFIPTDARDAATYFVHGRLGGVVSPEIPGWVREAYAIVFPGE